MAQDAYFVHIRSPVDFRRTLLESSREIIHLMQDYQTLLELRKQRLDMERCFKEETREIMLLVNKLEKALPKHSLNKLKEVLPGVIEEEKKRQPAKAKKGKKKPAKKEVLKTKQVSDIKKLEKALESIDSKLHSL
ncbi:MAG: hypothetical protein ABIE94_06605 [archaeon]